MKIEEYIPALARASLNNDTRTIRAVLAKMIKVSSNTAPDIANQISEALSYYESGMSSMRSIGYNTLPTDSDSRLDLIYIEEPIGISKPVFNDKLYKSVEMIIEERNNLNKLISAGLTPTSSILLYGQPGVGKTMLAKYLSCTLNLKFASLDMASSVSSYLGRTGQNLKKVLNYAKEKPTLLLLDEFDAIAKRRDDEMDLGELKRVVNVLLKELEDWPSHSILIGATNHPELLDKAIWRRFDKSIEIPLPDINSRIKLFKDNFVDVENITKIVKELGNLTDGMSPADIVKVCERSKKQNLIYGEKIEKAIIMEILDMTNNKTIDFNKEFSKIAREELNMTFRDISSVLGKSVSSIQNYVKKEC